MRREGLKQSCSIDIFLIEVGFVIVLPSTQDFCQHDVSTTGWHVTIDTMWL